MAVKAALCAAALWQWPRWLGIVMLGFGAMLHPSEMLALRRKDLVFPRDLGYEASGMFVQVNDPKTARFARRQHGRTDDPHMIWVDERIFGHLTLDQKLYPWSASSFRKQWDAVMQKLGIPHRQADGVLLLECLEVLVLYGSSEDINWVAWRGRWARVRTLEYYLQEVGAQLLVHSLDAASKYKIEQFAFFSWPVIHSFALQGRNA